ncbi:hypothetical protein ACJ73_09951, partial [Blastomyces percursus]
IFDADTRPQMLDRNQGQQFHYYQPGIGTYVTSTKIPSHAGTFSRIKRSWIKAKDAAIGSSFDHHVLAGYRFLMRYYSPGDEIFFFGFSRGARDLYNFMTAFRETFSRPIQRIQFLGLFDTVNSIPKSKSPWMSRNRFPYTARSSAKVIRHAVGIDERRSKFRQDLISQNQHCHHSHYRRRFSFIPRRFSREKKNPIKETTEVNHKSGAVKSATKIMRNTDAKPSKHLSTTGWTQPREENRYRPLYPRRSQNLRTSVPDNHYFSTDNASCAHSIANLPLQTQHITDGTSVQSDQTAQDIEEVCFHGCHADIGGGRGLMPGEKWPLSLDEFSGDYSPIHKSWSPDQDKRPNPPDIVINGVDASSIRDAPQDNPANSPSSRNFYGALNYSGTKGHIHDPLDFKSGLSAMSVLAWNMMEYLSFKKMDLQQDGSWAPIRWPLPCGEVRDIPVDAKFITPPYNG